MQIRIKLGDRPGINLENSSSSEASLGDSMGDGQDETDFKIRRISFDLRIFRRGIFLCHKELYSSSETECLRNSG